MRKITYHLSGRIIGGDSSICFQEEGSFNINVKDEQGKTAKLKCSVVVDTSAVNAEVDVDEGVDPWVVKTHVQRLVHLIVAGHGFAVGMGVDVDIQSMTPDASTSAGVPRVDQGIAARVMELIKGDPDSDPRVPYLRRAVSDYIRALREPQDAFTACFRAVESIRLFFQEQYQCPKRTAWVMLKKKLNIDADADDEKADYNYSGFVIRWLTDKAKETRHGGSGVLSQEEYSAALETAKTAIERFPFYDMDSQKVEGGVFYRLERTVPDLRAAKAETSPMSSHFAWVHPSHQTEDEN